MEFTTSIYFEVKNDCSCICAPPVCFIGVHSSSFTFFVLCTSVLAHHPNIRRRGIFVIQGAAEIVKRFKILVTCFSARVSLSAGV